MATLANLVVNLTAETAQFRRELERSTRQTQQQFQAMQRAADGVKRAATTMLATLGTAISIREYVRLSDQFTAMQGRLKLATDSTEEFQQAQTAAIGISNKYGQQLNDIASIIARLEIVTKGQNVTLQDNIDVVEALSAGFKIMGATQQEAASAILQFSQAMGSGVLRGEEFNAVFEASPRIMMAIADGMGVAVGELRNMAAAGELTADVVRNALISQLGKLREEADQIPPTFGAAFNAVRNAIMVSVGAFNEATGAAQGLIVAARTFGEAIQYMTGATDDASTSAKVLAGIIEGALVVAVARLAAGVAATTAGLLAEISATQASAKAALDKARATVAATGATAAYRQMLVAEAEAAVASAAGMRRLALVQTQLIPARTAATAATAAHTRALAAETAAAQTATVASRALRGALALIGGPAGVAIIGAYAIYELVSSMDEQVSAADAARNATAQLNAILTSKIAVDNAVAKSTLEHAKAELERTEAIIRSAAAQATAADVMASSDPKFAALADRARQQRDRMGELVIVADELRGRIGELSGRIAESGTVLTDTTPKVEAFVATTRTTDDAAKGAAKAVKELTDQIEETGPAAVESAQVQVQAAEESARAWEQLAESIQSNLSTAFENLLKGTGDVFETIKNWFIKLLADLAAAALARPIMLSIGMGAPAAALAGAGATGGGGLLGLLGGGYGSALTALGGLMGGGFGFGLGSTGALIASEGLFGAAAASLGNIGALIGAGEFSMALGAAVPILLPIAAGIAALGGLFKSTPPRAFVVGDAATGEILQQVAKKGGDATALVKMFNDIVDVTGSYLDNIGAELGSGVGNFDLHINPDRLRFTFRLEDGGMIETDVDPQDAAAVADAIARTVMAAVSQADFSEAAAPIGAFFESLTLDMIEALPQGAAEEILQVFSQLGPAAEAAAKQLPFLSDAIRGLAESGDVGAQGLAEFTVAAVAIGDALSTDPFEAYQQAIEQQTQTVWQSVHQQGDALREIAKNYDGSVEGTKALAEATVAYKNAAVQAAAQIAQAQQQIADSVKSSTERILLDTMNAAERQEYYLEQADRVRDEMRNVTDPAQIAALFAEFERYTLASWNELSDEQKALLRDNYIQSLEEGARVANEQLDAAAKTLADEFESITNAVTLGMLRAFEAAGLVVEGSAAEFEAYINSAGYQFEQAAARAGFELGRGVHEWIQGIINTPPPTAPKPEPVEPVSIVTGGPFEVKQFASGGYHPGGWRIVGEQGPELEYTGPSRIFSNDEIMGDDDLRADLRQLSREMRDTLTRFGQQFGTAVERMPRNIRVGVEIPESYTGGL